MIVKMKTKLQAGVSFVWEFHCSVGQKDMVRNRYMTKHATTCKHLFITPRYVVFRFKPSDPPAGVYSSFCSMTPLGVFLLTRDGMLVYHRVTA